MIPSHRKHFFTPTGIARLIATVGFIGFSPLAPGTMASLVAGLAFLLSSPYFSTSAWLISLVAVAAISVWSAQQMIAPEKSWWHPQRAKRAAPDNDDPSEIVIDEVMGMVVTMAFLPLTAKTVGIGFLLFRLFDILKPFPARRAEHLPGGWGIVMDDVVAGIYANVSLRIIIS
ncbi:MAG: phosphatidylglycerophosphatase A [candidate division KSB1 bacterium]|nr:phosphatidylglycerophosphatase A [candidate division KSB1 bacterium]